MKDFEYWNRRFREQELVEFNTDCLGLLWLKLKSISRKDTLPVFCGKCAFQTTSTRLEGMFRELYTHLSSSAEQAHAEVDAFIRETATKELGKVDIASIESNLFKVHSFEWGGDYRNSLDKGLVSTYVKTDSIIPFEQLSAAFENEIKTAASRYVVNSWYNYWSSVLTEWLFKTHPSVLPTVGKIRNVDFFVKSIPFDLKVTYLPKEYVHNQARRLKLPTELSLLKSVAKQCEISYDHRSSPCDCHYELAEKFKNKPEPICRQTLSTIQQNRLTLLHHATTHKAELIKWLYENQGEMRFGAENRLFIVLVDSGNFEDSWKLKRDLSFLDSPIRSYLDGFSGDKLESMRTVFSYKGTTFTAFSDIIFIVK